MGHIIRRFPENRGTQIVIHILDGDVPWNHPASGRGSPYFRKPPHVQPSSVPGQNQLWCLIDIVLVLCAIPIQAKALHRFKRGGFDFDQRADMLWATHNLQIARKTLKALWQSWKGVEDDLATCSKYYKRQKIEYSGHIVIIIHPDRFPQFNWFNSHFPGDKPTPSWLALSWP